MQTPPSHFQQELAALKDKLLTMANRAARAVETAVQALMDQNEALARQVKESDDIIDHLEVEIDEMAINLLAKAPLASDLRLIAVAMKANHDLERVGDEATTIARRTLELNREPPLKYRSDIPFMAAQSLSMLNDALDAFVRHDPVKARAIIPRDKEVDALNRQIHRKLAEAIVANPICINSALNLMVVAKSLERVGDHAKNVAEEVVFLFEGRDIRHTIKPAGTGP